MRARAGNYVDFDICTHITFIPLPAIVFDKRARHLYYPQYSFVDVTELG